MRRDGARAEAAARLETRDGRGLGLSEHIAFLYLLALRGRGRSRARGCWRCSRGWPGSGTRWRRAWGADGRRSCRGHPLQLAEIAAHCTATKVAAVRAVSLAIAASIAAVVKVRHARRFDGRTSEGPFWSSVVHYS